MPRPRASLATLITLVATAAAALGLFATVDHALDDDDAPWLSTYLGGVLVLSTVVAGVAVEAGLRRGAGRALLRIGLACLGFLALIRLLEWGGGAAFMMALAAALAVLGFAAAADAVRFRAAGRGLLAEGSGAPELAASVVLVMVFAALGFLPLLFLLGLLIRLISWF